MDVAFDAIRVAIRFFQMKLSALNKEVLCKKYSPQGAERIALNLCQQCEASLQFLQSLCQQKMFRERLLRNKVASFTDHLLFIILKKLLS